MEEVLLENFGAMVSWDWSAEEKAKLPAVTSQVLDDQEASYCIKSGDNFGVPMTAWIVVGKK